MGAKPFPVETGGIACRASCVTEMTSLLTNNSAIELILPSGWAQAIESLLEPDEKILAWVEPDLDQHLFFSTGVLILTSRRLLSCEPGAHDWLTWPVTATQSLQHRSFRWVPVRDAPKENAKSRPSRPNARLRFA